MMFLKIGEVQNALIIIRMATCYDVLVCFIGISYGNDANTNLLNKNVRLQNTGLPNRPAILSRETGHVRQIVIFRKTHIRSTNMRLGIA